MKNFIKPFIGVDNITFGAERKIIRKIINGNYTEIKRNQFAENTSDYYEKYGFFIEYSELNICEAIEFTNSSSLFFGNQDLFSLKYSLMKKMYNELSLNIEEEEGIGVTYHDLGFGVTCKYGTDRIESVIVFSDNYW